MVLPAGVTQLGTFKGKEGEKGDTGVLASLGVELLPWDEEPYAEMVGPPERRGAIVHIPMPLPAPETVNNDDATEQLILNPTKTQAALGTVVEGGVSLIDATPAGAAGVVSLTAFLGDAGASAVQMDLDPQMLSPELKNQATHPSVVDFQELWNGYRYWMAYTPYPFGDEASEEPVVNASTDGNVWVTPDGLTNPLDDAPGTSSHNSDTELVRDDNMLWVIWRQRIRTPVDDEVLWARSSTDGVTWTPKVEIARATVLGKNLLSPTILREGSNWSMWAVDTRVTPFALNKYSAPAITGPWTFVSACTVAGLPGGRNPWHISVIKLGPQYLMLLNHTPTANHGGEGRIVLARSVNGVAWECGSDVIQPALPGFYDKLYRGCMVPRWIGGQLSLDVWYGAWSSTPITWGIYRTRLTQTNIEGTAVALRAASAAADAHERDRVWFGGLERRAFARWRDAISQMGTKPVRLLHIGEGITEGDGVTSPTQVWTDRLAARLRKAFPAVPGNARDSIGWLPMKPSAASTQVYPWVASATSVDTGAAKSLRSIGLPRLPSGAYWEGTVTGTSIDIYYARAGDSSLFTVQVDGVSAGSRGSGPGALKGGMVERVSLGAPGPHTVRITAQADFAYIEGITVLDGNESSGVISANAGVRSRYASQWVPNAGAFGNPFRESIASFNPDVITIMLGMPEYTNQGDSAAYLSAIENLVTALRVAAPTASYVLMSPHKSATAAKADAWEKFEWPMVQLANRLNAGYVDWREFLPDSTGRAGAPSSPYYVDHHNLSVAGHQLVADRLAAYLLDRGY